jgi:hypothetical protein
MLLVPILVGFGVLRLCGLRVRADPLAVSALAYVAGSVALGALVGLWLALDAPGGTRGLLWAAPVLGLGLLVAGRRVPPCAEPAPEGTGHTGRARGITWVHAVLAVLVVSLLLHVVRSTLAPVIDGEGDEAQNWAIKAKLLFDARAPDVGYAARLLEFPWTNPDYPLLNPLMQVWTFAHAGAIVHFENRLVIQLGVFALLVLLAAGLRARVHPGLAAALLLVVGTCSMTRRLASSGGADLNVALGLLATAECALRWRRDGSPAWFRAGAVSLAFLMWTKNEGLLYGTFLVLLVWLWRGPRPRVRVQELAWLALPFAVAAGTWGFNALHGFPAYVMSGPEGSAAALGGYSLERVTDTFRHVFDHLFLRPDQHGYIPAAFLLVLVLAPRAALRGPAGPLAVALALTFAALVAVYPRYPFEIRWTVGLSAPRVLFHLVPSMTLVLALASTRLPRIGLGRRPRGEPAP